MLKTEKKPQREKLKEFSDREKIFFRSNFLYSNKKIKSKLKELEEQE